MVIKQSHNKESKNLLVLSEVVDSPKSAQEFLKMNKIKQNQIRAIIVVWDEFYNHTKGGNKEK